MRTRLHSSPLSGAEGCGRRSMLKLVGRVSRRSLNDQPLNSNFQTSVGQQVHFAGSIRCSVATTTCHSACAASTPVPLTPVKR